MSGTMVERRDQVFTTFFSLRVFSASTFSRKWPSTNGPFFRERATYSSTRRKRPHWACRTFLNPRTGPGTRCDFGQNGQTKRVPCAFGVRSTMTVQPGLHSLYSTGSSGTICDLRNGSTGLATGFAATRFTTRFAGRTRRFAAALRPADRFVRIARILFCSLPQLSVHRGISRLSSLPTNFKLLATLHNVLICTLVVARLFAQRRESPGRLRMIALYAAFSTAVRMVNRVHRHTANGRTNTAPTRTACFAEVLVFMVEVADLANRGHAIHGKLPNFSRGQLDQRNVALFAEQLRRSSRRTNDLSTTSRIQLEVVNHRARRNFPEECRHHRRWKPSLRLPAQPAEGCSACRHRHSARAPSLRCDSGRTRSRQ